MRHLAPDVGRVDPWPVLEFELRVRQVDQLDLARALVGHPAVARGMSLSLE